MKTKFGITAKIAEMLKLGDSGTIDSFLTKVVATLERECNALEISLTTNKGQHEHKILTLEYKLADAKEDFDACFTNINPENIKNNTAQEDRVEAYLSEIDKQEAKAVSIEKAISDEIARYEEEKKEKEDRISLRKARINKIISFGKK